MGTRSLTRVYETCEGERLLLANIYRHWDGEPAGQGQLLADFIDATMSERDRVLPPGITGLNGIWEFASFLVKYMWDRGARPSLMPADCICGQEWVYEITALEGYQNYHIRVLSGPVVYFGLGGEQCTHVAFEGNIAEFKRFLKRHQPLKPAT